MSKSLIVFFFFIGMILLMGGLGWIMYGRDGFYGLTCAGSIIAAFFFYPVYDSLSDE